MNYFWSAIVLVALTSSPLSAGVWAGGGGGDIIGDQANPWFLRNTKHVSMCAVIDRSAFHLPSGDLKAIETSIEQAVAYWRSEFQKSYVVLDLLSLATQTFELTSIVDIEAGQLKKPCPTDTDLTFQFGYINAEQSSWLVNNGHLPGKTIGIEVRTDYDPVTMRGRGFIFLAGDSGPWAISSRQAGHRPWQESPTRITEALKHELGHVFGLPHRGFGLNSVMAIDYVDNLLASQASSLINFQSPDHLGTEAPATVREYCDPMYDLRYGWQNLLEAPASDRCTKFEYSSDKLEFFTGTDPEHLIYRGVLKLEEKRTFEWQDAVRIFVTPEQTALTLPKENRGAGMPPLLVGPLTKINQRFGAFYNAQNRLTAKIDVRFNPAGLGLSTAVFRVEKDGVIYPNLDFEYGPRQ